MRDPDGSIKVPVELSLLEADNLVMMHDFCKRWFNHEYAVKGVQKLRAAIKREKERFAEQSELFETKP